MVMFWASGVSNFRSANRAALPPVVPAYSNEALTAAESTGAPSLNFIPARRWAVTDLLSALSSQVSAASGIGLPKLSHWIRLSYTASAPHPW